MKPKDQGTRLETRIKRMAGDRGIMAARLPEGGTQDKGDVWLVCPPDEYDTPRVVLWWKRLIPSKDGGRRTADGVPEIVCMTPDTFLLLLESYMQDTDDADTPWVVEAKARQNLNVTRELDKARRKAGGL